MAAKVTIQGPIGASSATPKPLTTRKKKSVAILAQKYMDRHVPPIGYTVRISPDDVELRGETWYVVAEPSMSAVPYTDFINRITDAAMEMEDAEGMYVLFVPTLPPDGE